MADGSLPPGVSTLENEDDDAWAQRQLDQLQELAEIGMEIARALPAQAEKLADNPEAAGQLALTFSRVARAVRQTLALEARLRQDLKAAADTARVEAKARSEAARLEAVAQRKLAVRRTVRQAIDDHEPRVERGGLRYDLDKRIEYLADDDEGLFLDRPFSAVLQEICNLLGFRTDWTRWRKEPWALAELRHRPPGSPFARLHDDMIAQGVWEEEDPDTHPPP